jgi:hypothetical protein
MAASTFVPARRIRTGEDRPSLRLVTAPARPNWRRGPVLVAALLVAVVMAVVVLAAGAASARSETPEVIGQVVLQPGETLWDIAVRSAAPGVDPRRQMEVLRTVNGFAPGALDAWTVVLIPAPAR